MGVGLSSGAAPLPAGHKIREAAHRNIGWLRLLGGIGGFLSDRLLGGIGGIGLLSATGRRLGSTTATSLKCPVHLSLANLLSLFALLCHSPHRLIVNVLKIYTWEPTRHRARRPRVREARAGMALASAYALALDAHAIGELRFAVIGDPASTRTAHAGARPRSLALALDFHGLC